MRYCCAECREINPDLDPVLVAGAGDEVEEHLPHIMLTCQLLAPHLEEKKERYLELAMVGEILGGC